MAMRVIKTNPNFNPPLSILKESSMVNNNAIMLTDTIASISMIKHLNKCDSIEEYFPLY